MATWWATDGRALSGLEEDDLYSKTVPLAAALLEAIGAHAHDYSCLLEELNKIKLL